MEAQSTDSNWANQTEDELFKLLYITSKGGKSKIYGLANNIDSIPLPYIGLAYNMHPQVPAISSLSYENL